MKHPKPLDSDYEPILCARCLATHRAQLTWLDQQTLNLICSVHGPIYALQEIER